MPHLWLCLAQVGRKRKAIANQGLATVSMSASKKKRGTTARAERRAYVAQHAPRKATSLDFEAVVLVIH